MPHRKVTTTTRQARGRERALPDAGLSIALAAALDAVARHRASGEPLDRSVADVIRGRRLGPRERRAVGDIVFGWARLRTAVEHLVDDALKRAGGIKPNRRERDLCALLLAQAGAGLDVDPRARARFVGELGELGELGALVDDVVARGLPAESSLPEWLVERLTKFYPDAADLMKALRKPAPLVLAVEGMSAADVVTAVNAVKGAKASLSPVVPSAVRVEGRVRVPESLRERVWPMDDGSQAVVGAVDVKPGERVLDLCAGGGGKARLLKSLGALVVAADPVLERMAQLSVPRVVADGRAPPFRAGTFDKVLVDAPCSGTGTLRRAPDVAQRQSLEDVVRFAELQRALLESALTLVKPGGVVVYATCSLLREENDDVVDAVLKGSAGVVEVKRQRWLPHTDGTDGFFAATLKTR